MPPAASRQMSTNVSPCPQCLEDAADRISYDELMARPAEFASNRLAGVWWLPSARSNMDLVLASRSDDPLLATIEVRSLGTRGDTRAMDVKLRPHETQIVDVPKALTIQGHGKQEWAAGSIALRHSGKPGDLVARGMIEDRAMHYSSVVEFTDPAAGKGSEIHASGLRLGSVAGQPLYPMVVVYNAGETKSTINLRIPYSSADGATRSAALDPIVLAPGEVRELSPEVQGQTARLDFDQIVSASLEVVYSTAPGTVLASVQSVSRDGDHVFRAPMVDPQTKGSAGNYPWKLDDSTSTYVYLKNVTAQTQKYTVQVDFDGGSYVLGLQELAPHATFKLDLRALRDGQKPDQHKTVIPIDAKGGQVNWSVIGPDNHAMIGRSEYVSQAHGIASTFACSNCCPDSYYRGYINPFSATFPYDASMGYMAYQQNQNCYGGILVQFVVNPGSWTSNNPSVTRINSNGLASGVTPGSTSVVTCWTVYLWHFAGPDLGCISSSARICQNAGAIVTRAEITSADVTQDKIHVNLSPSGLTGTLTLQLAGSGQHTIRQANRSSGSYDETFDFPNLGTGEYTQVKATWAVGGGTPAIATYNYHIKVLGVYRQTQYNTPSESTCPGTATPVTLFNASCNSSAGSMLSGFVFRVHDINTGTGSGHSIKYNDVLVEALCSGRDGTSFRRDATITGTPGSVGNDTVAVCRDSGMYVAGWRVYIHGQGVKTITDRCTACCIDIAHIDNYTTNTACSLGSLPNALTILLF